MQVKLKTNVSVSRYVIEKLWLFARLLVCPFHPDGGCGFHRHGTYGRWWKGQSKHGPAKIVRYYCPKAGATISLLPDFFCARRRGDLDTAEEVTAELEMSGAPGPQTRKHHPLRSADDKARDKWTRRTADAVNRAAASAAPLLPDVRELLAGRPPTIRNLRAAMNTNSVLRELRHRCARHLQHLPPPLGFRPPSAEAVAFHIGLRCPAPSCAVLDFQHSTGRDPPPAAA